MVMMIVTDDERDDRDDCDNLREPAWLIEYMARWETVERDLRQEE